MEIDWVIEFHCTPMDNNTNTPVLVERDGPIAILTLSTPGKLNAFSMQMRDRMSALFTEFNADPSCRAIVLTGADGNLTAGGDVRQFNDKSIAGGRARLKAGSSTLMRAIVGGSKPVIVAAEGYAYGAGMAFTAAADYAVAAKNTKFSCAFTKLAFMPDLGLLWTLPRRVGLAHAKRLIALANTIDGTEAGRLGLVDEVVEPGKALEVAIERARQYAETPPLAFEFVKSALSEDLEPMLRREVDLQAILMLSEDHEEGKKAFAERRKPVFKGR